MSPKARRDRDNALYAYLLDEQRRRQQHENLRLLYVALTRARESLYLSAVFRLDSKGAVRAPERDTLLAGVWDRLEQAFALQMQQVTPVDTAPVRYLAGIRRLDVNRPMPPLAEQTRDDASLPCSDDFGRRHTARVLGDILHQDLCQLAGEADIPAAIAALSSSWSMRLRARGLERHQELSALERLTKAMQLLKSSATASWLLQRRKVDGAEQALAVLDNRGRPRRYVVDRTFIEDGARWIVDYKTSEPAPGEAPEVFFASQVKRYQAQLEAYAAIFAPNVPRIALYFPLLDKLLELSSLQ